MKQDRHHHRQRSGPLRTLQSLERNDLVVESSICTLIQYTTPDDPAGHTLDTMRRKTMIPHVMPLRRDMIAGQFRTSWPVWLNRGLKHTLTLYLRGLQTGNRSGESRCHGVDCSRWKTPRRRSKYVDLPAQTRNTPVGKGQRACGVCWSWWAPWRGVSRAITAKTRGPPEPSSPECDERLRLTSARAADLGFLGQPCAGPPPGSGRSPQRGIATPRAQTQSA